MLMLYTVTDKLMSVEQWGNDTDDEQLCSRRKSLPSATVSPTIPWTGLFSNPCLRAENWWL